MAGWMAHLRAQSPPLATTTCIGRLFALLTLFHELARTSHLPELVHLLLIEDIPHSPHTLPRPLTPEQDQLLQQEFMRRNDPGGNVFVLFRSTGMRSGECVDLSYDCLRSTGPNLCAIHAPLGKLNAWSLSMPSPVISCTGCGSSASLILCPPMDGCWRDQETRLQSWFNSAISCTWSATRSHFQQI